MEEPAWSDTPSHVNHLTASSFLTFVKSKGFTLVMFYAPWCGHCKKAKPEFEKAADELKDVEIKALAAVDCTKHMGMLCYKTINVFYILGLIFFVIEICKSEGVQGYPTFKLFERGASSSTTFNAERTSQGFVQFLNDQKSANESPSASDTPAQQQVPREDL